MCPKNADIRNGSVTLSRVSILVGFICTLSYFGAFVGTGWVFTKESYRLTNLNLYTSVTFKIGLWRACYSFKRINSTIIVPSSGCTSISYLNWSEITEYNLGMNSDIESTLNIFARIRWCTIFIGFGFIFLLIGLVYSVLGHYYQDNKTLLASAIYTLSGLSLAAGLFVFVCILTDSFTGTTTFTFDQHSWDTYDSSRSHDYKYGWCFLTVSVVCIFVEIVAVLCITVHYRRCQTISLMIRDMMPIIEEKSSSSYFSTKDTGCLMKTDESEKTECKNQSDDINGILSETPPDICSTFLNAEITEDNAEIDVHQTRNSYDQFIQTSSKVKKGNFATLNTRNYRCLNYSHGTNRKYSTLGSGNIMTMEKSCSSSSSSRNQSLNMRHCHQNTCNKNLATKMKTAEINTNKHSSSKEMTSNMTEMQRLSSCDDFNL